MRNGAGVDEVAQAMAREDFPALQRLYERYTRAPAERTASGAFKITLFQDGVRNVLEQDSSAGEALKALSWPKNVLAGITEKGIAANPEDYRLYLGSLDYLLPKWGGSAEEVDRFINHVAKLAPRDQGREFYARLYSGAAEYQFHHSLYSDSLVEWAKMKKGLEDWNSRYPTSWNKNIFAYHACIAGDRATTRRLLRELGNDVNLVLWEPNERSTYSTCRSWALQADDPVFTKPSAPKSKASGI